MALHAQPRSQQLQHVGAAVVEILVVPLQAGPHLAAHAEPGRGAIFPRQFDRPSHGLQLLSQQSELRGQLLRLQSPRGPIGLVRLRCSTCRFIQDFPEKAQLLAHLRFPPIHLLAKLLQLFERLHRGLVRRRDRSRTGAGQQHRYGCQPRYRCHVRTCSVPPFGDVDAVARQGRRPRPLVSKVTYTSLTLPPPAASLPMRTADRCGVQPPCRDRPGRTRGRPWGTTPRRRCSARTPGPPWADPCWRSS